MNLTKKLEKEIEQFLDDYWNSYFSGDIDHWATYLVDDYRNIGGTEEEVWNSKQEILDYTHRMIDQMKGLSEIRNKEIKIIAYDPYIMAHELLDIYIKIENEWTFYQKFRLSSLIQKQPDGWKVLHQHGSYPDSKTQEGEAFAFDTLQNENLKLQQAIKARTIELENKTRELEIEASLERIRTVAMSMNKADDLLNICKTQFMELKQLGFSEIRNALIGIFHDDKNYFTDYDYSDFSGGGITNIPYNKNPIIDRSLQQMKSATDAFTEFIVEGKELEEWKAFRKQNGEYDDIRLSNADVLYYYFYSISRGNVGISSFKKISDEQVNILKKFRNVFDLSYKRYVDISNAEAQAKEAQIELALERVRARAMAMQKSDELSELVDTVFKELTKLDFALNWCIINIIDEPSLTNMVWAANPETNKPPESYLMKFEDYPFHHSMMKGYQERKTKHVYVLEGKEKKTYDDYLFNKTEWRRVPKAAQAASRAMKRYVATFAFSNFGGLQTVGEEYLSEENLDILSRFGKVFDLTYTRFNDLQKAEAQAREAKIEASLERMRSVAMSIRKSEEMIQVAASLYHELKSLGISNIRNAQIVIKITGDEMYLVCVYSDDTSEVFKESRYDTPPVTQQIYDELERSSEALYQREITGKEFEQWLKWREDTGTKIDSRLLAARSVSFCLYSIGEGHLGVSAYNDITNEQLTVLKRFRNVFELSYRRFMDVAKSEEQAEKLQQEKDRLEFALNELQATQKQLIQSEKMASLGELTAGIAHEIQNPLNFVNNFSEVSTELIDEMNEEIAKGNLEDAAVIASDLKQNLKKINHHGKRAGDIVKGMLQHSRSSSATKEPTDINKLADEYLRLAYHGLRAKDKSFNAIMKTEFDEMIGNINIVPQDIGRVILNLITNAFYAVSLPPPAGGGFSDPDYKHNPTVWVITKKIGDKVEIKVRDNGPGIPQKILDKIFQPFFTTKPTGQGTGLGLSLSYDIVKALGGELKVETKEGEGSEFMIRLPTN